MALIHGKNGKVLVGANQILRIQSFNINRQIESVDAHSMGDEWKDHLTGFKDWSASISCLYDPADTNGQEALDIGDQITLYLYPNGNDTGEPEYTGTATVLSVPLSQSKDGIVTVSFEATGKGALTIGVVA